MADSLAMAVEFASCDSSCATSDCSEAADSRVCCSCCSRCAHCCERSVTSSLSRVTSLSRCRVFLSNSCSACDRNDEEPSSAEPAVVPAAAPAAVCERGVLEDAATGDDADATETEVDELLKSSMTLNSSSCIRLSCRRTARYSCLLGSERISSCSLPTCACDCASRSCSSLITAACALRSSRDSTACARCFSSLASSAERS